LNLSEQQVEKLGAGNQAAVMQKSSVQCVRRLGAELKSLSAEETEKLGFSVGPENSENFTHWIARLNGPTGTPYSG
jgi:ubiquitin-protein ligase